MKSRFLSSICIGIVAISLMPFQSAYTQPLDVPEPPPANIFKALNLSDTQKQQIQAILGRDRETQRAAVQELRAKEQELRAMMDGNATREALIQKFSQLQNLKRQNEQRRFDQMLSMREILTPQQRSELSKVAKDANSNIRERRQRRFLRPDNQF
jgi:periplasmic protein CpxP/Spy